MAKQESHCHHPSLPFFPETRHKTRMREVPSLYLRKKDVLTTTRGDLRVKKPVQTNLVKLIFIFHVISSPFTTQAHTPLSCQICLFIFLKDIKASFSGHFFRSSFSCEGSHEHLKIEKKKLYAFLLLICLCQFNFQIQPETLRWLRETHSFPTLGKT